MSSVLAGGPPLPGDPQPTAAAAPAPPPSVPPPGGAGQRNNALTVIAGVGVLLLAMGVGVLIGRSGASKQSVAQPQIISVASTPAAAPSTAPAAEAPFSGDWPSGTTGYTVQLRTLPQSGTSVSAVEAAKAAAGAKGAKAVGALKSEQFSSLTAGNYVIYSGVYHRKAEAEKALSSLRKSFPGAKVLVVSNGGSSSGGSGSSSSSGVGSSESHPAPPSVLNSLKSAKGKSYEEKSKNLPDVVETG